MGETDFAVLKCGLLNMFRDIDDKMVNLVKKNQVNVIELKIIIIIVKNSMDIKYL